MYNPMSLKDRKIIVMGASSGIGRETAIVISKLGGICYLVARREDRLNETLNMLEGEGHKLYPFDLSELSGIKGLIEKIVAENGKLDGLVYSAGIMGLRPLNIINIDFMEHMMGINYYSFVEAVQAFSKKTNSLPNSSIVGVSSIATIIFAKTQGVYTATKAAMEASAKVFSQELMSRKIRINTVRLALVNTDGAGVVADNFNDVPQPLGLCEPIEAANAICFLLSDASRYITGTNLEVNAGIV